MIFGLPLKISLQNLMWVFEGAARRGRFRQTYLMSTNLHHLPLVSSPLFPSWCWGAYDHNIGFNSSHMLLSLEAVFCPRPELKVLATTMYVSLTMEQSIAKILSNFCSDLCISPLGNMSINLQGILPCVSRFVKFPIEDFEVMDGWTSLPHSLLTNGTVGWLDLTGPLNDLPSGLHCLQLYISNDSKLSHVSTCHVILVELYEQDKNQVKMGLDDKSFEDLFVVGSDWAKFIPIQDMQTDQQLHLNRSHQGPHPELVPSGKVSSPPSIFSLKRPGYQFEYDLYREQPCAKCKQVATVGTHFRPASPSQREDTPLYLARRLGIGMIVLDA